MDPKPQAMDVEERPDPSYAQPAQYVPLQPTPTQIIQQPQPAGGVGIVVVNQQDTRTCLGQQQNAQAWATGLFGCFEDCGSCKSIVLRRKGTSHSCMLSKGRKHRIIYSRFFLTYVYII